jgi:hypothetical protein
MSIDFETWKKGILDIARRLASRSYQEQSWLGKGPAVSSPEELFNELFDDQIVERFAAVHAADLSAEQQRALRELIDKMNEYGAASPSKLDPATVLRDPQWEGIRNSALRFVKADTKGSTTPSDRKNPIRTYSAVVRDLGTVPPSATIS